MLGSLNQNGVAEKRNKYHTSELAAKINTIAWTQNNRKQRAKFMLYLGGAMELNL